MAAEIPQDFSTPLKEGVYETEGYVREDSLLNILPASVVGSEGDFQVAQFLRSGAQHSLPEDHGLKVGDEVLITPVTRHHPSGGSIIKHRITPKEE